MKLMVFGEVGEVWILESHCRAKSLNWRVARSALHEQQGATSNVTSKFVQQEPAIPGSTEYPWLLNR